MIVYANEYFILMKKPASNQSLLKFCLFVILLSSGSCRSDTAVTLPLREVARFDEDGFRDLSGIVYHPIRQTLFAVEDEGTIVELGTNGTVVAERRILPGADLEGITCNPETGILYVVVEGDDEILEINPEVLEIIRTIPIDRQVEGSLLIDPGGNGLEGITFVSHNATARQSTFALVNQSKELEGPDPSLVLLVEVDEVGQEPARIIRHFSLGVTGLSDITYDPAAERFLVISDSENVALLANLAGRVLNQYPLAGKDQEGITLDADGFLYIAQDSDKGLLKFGSAQ